MRAASRSGFTLIELTVVIAVVGLIAAIAVPAVQSARESARRTGCQNNLRQIGAALLAFESSHKKFPAGRDAHEGREHSWSTAVLSQLDQAAVYQQYDFQLPWSEGINLELAATRLSVFLCPSATGDWPGKADYGGNYGSTLSGLEAGFSKGRGWEAGTLLAVRMPMGRRFRTSPVRMGEVTDGASQTFLVLESADRPAQQGGLWASGHNCLAVDEPVNSDDSNELRSRHPGGALALLADGSVRMVTETMDTTVLGGLATRAAGELLE